MASKEKKNNKKVIPMLKTVKQMAAESGIGQGYLRSLMDSRQLAYVQIGNKKLIADQAVWDWYEEHKIPALGGKHCGNCSPTSEK